IIFGGGENSSGNITLNGGSLDIRLFLWMNLVYGELSHFHLMDGNLTIGTDAIVGYADKASFTQDGGINTIGGILSVADHPYYTHPAGTYTLNSGILNANKEIISNRGGILEGQHSVGTFNQFGGENNVTTSLHLGEDQYSWGTYNLTDGTLQVGGDEYISNKGRGIINQSGGTHHVIGTVFMGNEPKMDDYVKWEGIYNLDGGSLIIDTDLYVGNNNGRGIFNQTGGTCTVNNKFEIGSISRTGTFSIKDGILNTHILSIANNGTLETTGVNPTITADNFIQSDTGTLKLTVNASGICNIEILDTATFAGTLIPIDENAPYGKFSILTADNGILGEFHTDILPNENWDYDITGNTLWLEHRCQYDLIGD
ncbi:MAG: hypothetical protein MI892_28090, partial [Desulfobacterales bacterium]|nr:hypothetical protein [Desulfobacterales bacterium]